MLIQPPALRESATLKNTASKVATAAALNPVLSAMAAGDSPARRRPRSHPEAEKELSKSNAPALFPTPRNLLCDPV
jgi:hypothetical protein